MVSRQDGYRMLGFAVFGYQVMDLAAFGGEQMWFATRRPATSRSITSTLSPTNQ
jgi:hypothetical protein